MILQFLVLLLVLLLCSLGPGLVTVRPLRWSPLENLCGAVAVSLILIYLAALGVYAVGLPRWAYWTITTLAAVTTIASARDLHRLWRNHHVRRAILATAAFAAWTMLLLSLVKNYGGGWYGDWYEHYERSLFFLDHWPRDATFLEGRYTLPARPPMMNLLAAHLLAHVNVTGGDRYAFFQAASMLLSALIVLPCTLVAGLLVRRGGGRAWLLLAILACNPMLVQNATFSWTRVPCAFYVILGICFYLRGWHKRDPGRLIMSVACLAAATAIHYSAVPYALALAAHYFVVVLRHRPTRTITREVVGGLVALTLILGSWLAFSTVAYGPGATFAANSTVTDTARLTLAENLPKIARNVYFTLIPHGLRGVPTSMFSRGNTFLGYIRDYWFKIYQANLPLAVGVAGVIAVPLLTMGQLRAAPPSPRAFWIWLLAFTIPVSIAVHGTEDPWGLAHIGLQPLIYLGLTLLAAGFGALSRRLRWVVIVGLTIDFLQGVLLHFALQAQPLHLDMTDPDRHAQSGLGLMPGLNYELKVASGVSFWADHIHVPATALIGATAVGFIIWIAIVIRAARSPHARG